MHLLVLMSPLLFKCRSCWHWEMQWELRAKACLFKLFLPSQDLHMCLICKTARVAKNSEIFILFLLCLSLIYMSLDWHLIGNALWMSEDSHDHLRWLPHILDMYWKCDETASIDFTVCEILWSPDLILVSLSESFSCLGHVAVRGHWTCLTVRIFKPLHICCGFCGPALFLVCWFVARSEESEPLLSGHLSISLLRDNIFATLARRVLILIVCSGDACFYVLVWHAVCLQVCSLSTWIWSRRFNVDPAL